MPELPEVETIRRQLAPQVEGRVLEELWIGDPRWCEPRRPADLRGAVAGRRIERLSRRGKYLVWSLAGEVHLIMHLRMTGALLYRPLEPVPYERARLLLNDGTAVSFADPRRFGTAQLAEDAAELEEFMAARLGLEPLDPRFTANHLRALTRASRAPIKALLLDQRRVAGVGNIYADEALFRAGIHPLRESRRLDRRRLEALLGALGETLRAGIDARGASIDDFRHVDGARGSFQERFLVHRRAGEPCPRCGAPVRKLVAAGRGTYVCERCQPRPRPRRRPPVPRQAVSS